MDNQQNGHFNIEYDVANLREDLRDAIRSGKSREEIEVLENWLLVGLSIHTKRYNFLGSLLVELVCKIKNNKMVFAEPESVRQFIRNHYGLCGLGEVENYTDEGLLFMANRLLAQIDCILPQSTPNYNTKFEILAYDNVATIIKECTPRQTTHPLARLVKAIRTAIKQFEIQSRPD